VSVSNHSNVDMSRLVSLLLSAEMHQIQPKILPDLDLSGFGRNAGATGAGAGAGAEI